ncbi:hypothetical protein, partial [Escherichia coli]
MSYVDPGDIWRGFSAGTTVYHSNAFNERTVKLAPHGAFRYVYTPDQRLLSEHQDNGDVWTNYLWF